MIFRGKAHEETFEMERSYRPGGDNRYLAALYLLTADRRLWWQVRDEFGIREVNMGNMKPKCLSGEAYVFYLLSRDILFNTETVSVTELADRGVLSSKCFQIVTTALMIKGYGLKRTQELLPGGGI